MALLAAAALLCLTASLSSLDSDLKSSSPNLLTHGGKIQAWAGVRKGKVKVRWVVTSPSERLGRELKQISQRLLTHCLSTEQRKGKFPSVRVCKVTLLLQFVTVLMTRRGFQFAYNSVVLVHACKICYMSIQIKYKNLVWINP